MGNVNNLYKISPKFFPKIIVGHLSFTPVFPLMEVVSYYLSMLTSCHISIPPTLPSIAYTSRAPNIRICICSLDGAEFVFCLECFSHNKQTSQELCWTKIQIHHLVKLSMYEVYNHSPNHRNYSTNRNYFQSLPLDVFSYFKLQNQFKVPLDGEKIIINRWQWAYSITGNINELKRYFRWADNIGVW